MTVQVALSGSAIVVLVSSAKRGCIEIVIILNDRSFIYVRNRSRPSFGSCRNFTLSLDVRINVFMSISRFNHTFFSFVRCI
jgi:hypothetical protein